MPGDGVNSLPSRNPIQDQQIQKNVDSAPQEPRVQSKEEIQKIIDSTARSAFQRSDPKTILREVTKSDASGSTAGSTSGGRARGCALPGG